LCGEFEVVKEDLSGIDPKIFFQIDDDRNNQAEEVAKKIIKMRGSTTVYKKSRMFLNGSKNKSLFPIVNQQKYETTAQNITSKSLNTLKYSTMTKEFSNITIGLVTRGDCFGDINCLS